MRVAGEEDHLAIAGRGEPADARHDRFVPHDGPIEWRRPFPRATSRNPHDGPVSTGRDHAEPGRGRRACWRAVDESRICRKVWRASNRIGRHSSSRRPRRISRAGRPRPRAGRLMEARSLTRSKSPLSSQRFEPSPISATSEPSSLTAPCMDLARAHGPRIGTAPSGVDPVELIGLIPGENRSRFSSQGHAFQAGRLSTTFQAGTGSILVEDRVDELAIAFILTRTIVRAAKA